MAKLPKKYFISDSVFDLTSKSPSIDIDDFLSLSKKALSNCEHVYLKYKIKKKHLKRLYQLSATYSFKVHDNIKLGKGYTPNVTAKEQDSSLSLPDICIVDNTDGLTKAFLEKREPSLPEREYKVQIIGKPPKEIKEDNDDRIFMTSMGPISASALGVVRRRFTVEMCFPTVTVDPSDKKAPIVQNVYYNRMALATALEKRIPFQTSIRDRNAFKYRICCELTDEEFINLAADTKAQDELVKGLAVKK